MNLFLIYHYIEDEAISGTISRYVIVIHYLLFYCVITNLYIHGLIEIFMLLEVLIKLFFCQFFFYFFNVTLKKSFRFENFFDFFSIFFFKLFFNLLKK